MANMIEIGWDTLEEDPVHKADFEDILSRCATLLPEIETLYTTLVAELTDVNRTSTSCKQREMFLDDLEDELCATYQVIDLWERYSVIESLITLDNQLPQ